MIEQVEASRLGAGDYIRHEGVVYEIITKRTTGRYVITPLKGRSPRDFDCEPNELIERVAQWPKGWWS